MNILNNPRFLGFGSNGEMLVGGKLYTYEPGTDTEKTTYTRTGTAQTNPIILNSRGEPDNAIYGTGAYKIVLKTTDDVTIWTEDNVPLSDAVVLIVAISEDTTWTTGYSLAYGSRITVATGKNLTINGPFEAGPYQVFDGDGTVVFGPGATDHAKLEWFGGSGDGTTDNYDSLVKAWASHPVIQLGSGIYYADFTDGPIYLNHLDGTTQGWNYSVYGKGQNLSQLLIGNLNATYAFKRNEDAAGDKVAAYPRYPGFRADSLCIKTDATCTTPDFMKIREQGMVFKNVRFWGWRNCVVSEDYCDNPTFVNIQCVKCDPTGWLYQQISNGDGLRIQSCWVSTASGNHDYGLAKIRGTNAATISNNVNGRIYVYHCTALSIVNNHAENIGASAASIDELPWVYWADSTGEIRENFVHNNRATYPILIDDDAESGAPTTDLTIAGNDFSTFWSSTSYATKNYDVYIKSLSTRAVVHLNKNRSNWRPSVGTMSYHNGFTVGSAIAALQPYLANYRHLLLGQVSIQPWSSTDWRIITPSCLRELYQVTTPAIVSISDAGVSESVYSNLAADTYYYKICTYTDIGHSSPSTESNVTTADANGRVYISARVVVPCCYLRIWRGTSTGSYDRYVDIPFSTNVFYANDCGDTFNGVAWITTGVPTVPSDNTTLNGYMMVGGKRIFHGSTYPTSTEFVGVVGDIVWDTNAASGATPGWYCTAAGTPGSVAPTYKAMANLA